jgi:exosortase
MVYGPDPDAHGDGPVQEAWVTQTGVLESEQVELDSPPGPPRQERRRRLPVAVFTSLVLLGHAPLLVRFVVRAGIVSPYQFAPLLLLGALYLSWERLRELPPHVGPGRSRVLPQLFLPALLLLWAASYLWIEWLALLAGGLSICAILYWIGGRSLLRHLGPIIALLVVPFPPIRFVWFFTMGLRELAVTWSSALLDALGIVHLRSGMVLDIPGRQLLVKEACSGINSVMAVIAVTLFLGLWRRRSPGRIVVLILAGIAAVILANIVRIVGGVWLLQRFGIDLFSTSAHESASFVIFAVCLLLLASFDSLVSWIIGRDMTPAPPRSRQSLSDRASGAARRLPRVTGWMWLLAGAYVAAGLLQVRQGWAAGYWQTLWGKSYSLRADAVFTVPGWQRVLDDDPALRQRDAVKSARTDARVSLRWQHREGRLRLTLALDYPFKGYYDLTRCYAGTGWHIDNPAQGTTGGAYIQTPLSMPDSHGQLFFALVDEKGNWLSPQQYDDYNTLAGRLKGPRPDALMPTYLIQVMTESYAPFTPEETDQIRELFFQARHRLAQQILQQLEGKNP